MEKINKHEVGDKFVIEIDRVFSQDGDTLYRAKGMKSLVFDEYGLNILKPLSAYMDPLEKEAEENYRLGANDEYEKWKEHAARIRAEGQQEAWELAQKIFNNEDLGGYSIHELNEIFDTSVIREIINLTYSEAAAKVEGYEKKKKGFELQMSPLYARDVLQSMVEQNCNGNESEALVIAINALTEKIGDGVE